MALLIVTCGALLLSAGSEVKDEAHNNFSDALAGHADHASGRCRFTPMRQQAGRRRGQRGGPAGQMR